MNKSETRTLSRLFLSNKLHLLALLSLFLSTEKRDFSTFLYTSTSEIDFVDRVSVPKPTLTLISHLGQNVGLGEE